MVRPVLVGHVNIRADGLIAVNDKAAQSDVLKAAYKAASGKKTFVWTLEHFQKKMQQVLDSDTRYFLIAKNPVDMKKILVDMGFKCGITKVIVGPCNDRDDAVKTRQQPVHHAGRSSGSGRYQQSRLSGGIFLTAGCIHRQLGQI